MFGGTFGLAHGDASRFRGVPAVEFVLAALALLTAAAWYFHDPLTSRRIVISPASGADLDPYAYSDASSGGRSQAAIDPRAPFRWTCELRRSLGYGYCGFGMIFAANGTGRGLDASGFSRIRLDLDYQGPGSALRIALKNERENYARFGAKDLYKPAQATVAVVQGTQSVTLRSRDFVVAQWWLESARQPPRLEQPDFDNIVALEILTGPNAERGTHRIAIGRITLYRTIISDELWYGAIAAIWLAVLVGLLVRGRLEIAKWRRRSADALSRTIDHVPHMVWSWRVDGFTHFNKRWEEFTGNSDVQSEEAMALVHPDERESVSSEWRRLIAAGQPFQIECRIQHRSGAYRWVVNKAVPELDSRGSVVAWYGTCTDVHERVVADRALNEMVTKLKWTSENDGLTAVANRRSFHTELERSCRRLVQGKQVALLLVDLDHFKHVNDSYGHGVGDDLLKVIAKRLSAAVRGCDIVGRLGGDEFAVILTDIESDEAAVAVAAKLAAAIAGPVHVADRVLRIGASIGVALYPMHAVSTDELLGRADAALYELKRSGRGGASLFRESTRSKLVKAADQLTLARRATREERIVPVYHPKVDLRSGAVVGFEALLRWSAPGKTLQLPHTLQEAFSDYELSARIGETMQRAIARDIRKWRDGGVEVGRISVNAAPSEFLRDNYAERLLAILAAEGVSPTDFEVEITEYALLEQGPDHVARALRVLREAGVTVSLDDFGTGHSSLSHLRDFAVDLIKIDRSFIQQMARRSEIAAIVSAVTSLARSLMIDVVAEGVESRKQADLLREMGCTFAQGHLFGRPMEAAKVASFGLEREAA